MSFKKLIPGCFGEQDHVFAGHTSDIASAHKVLLTALSEISSWAEYENAIRDYLVSKGCKDGHISAQIMRARDLSNYFSND